MIVSFVYVAFRDSDFGMFYFHFAGMGLGNAFFGGCSSGCYWSLVMRVVYVVRVVDVMERVRHGVVFSKLFGRIHLLV